MKSPQPESADEASAPETSPRPPRRSRLRPLILLLALTSAAAFGWFARGYQEAALTLPEAEAHGYVAFSTPDPKQMREWLKDLRLARRQYEEEIEFAERARDENKRAYGILRFSKGMSQDDEACKRIFEKTVSLEQDLASLMAKASELSGMDAELQKLLDRGEGAGSLELSRETERLLRSVQDVINYQRANDLVEKGGLIIPDDAWEDREPDELMRVRGNQ